MSYQGPEPFKCHVCKEVHMGKEERCRRCKTSICSKCYKVTNFCGECNKEMWDIKTIGGTEGGLG